MTTPHPMGPLLGFALERGDAAPVFARFLKIRKATLLYFQPQQPTEVQTMEITENHIITRKEAAEITGRSVQWITNLTNEGFLTRVGRGQYEIGPFLKGIVGYFESRIKASADADVATAAIAARTREIELRTAQRLSELIAVDDVLEVITQMTAIFRAELLALPADYTSDPDEQRKMQAEVDATLKRIAAASDKARAAIQGGDDSYWAETEE